MRTIVLAVTLLCACFLLDVSGAHLRADPKQKEGKTDDKNSDKKDTKGDETNNEKVDKKEDKKKYDKKEWEGWSPEHFDKEIAASEKKIKQWDDEVAKREKKMKDKQVAAEKAAAIQKAKDDRMDWLQPPRRLTGKPGPVTKRRGLEKKEKKEGATEKSDAKKAATEKAKAQKAEKSGAPVLGASGFVSLLLGASGFVFFVLVSIVLCSSLKSLFA